jgi:hypothetical protein
MPLQSCRFALLSAALLGMLAISVSGCNTGGPAFKLTPVTGTVKLNGAPLADAAVTFLYNGPPESLPADFTGSVGKTDANGKYELITNGGKGTIAGKFKVIVQKTTDKDGKPLKEDLAGGMDIEQLKLGGQAIEWIPPKWSDINQVTETADVVDGTPLVKDINIEK